jgi:hypothetical protein
MEKRVKTPFCVAIAVRQRELEALRREVGLALATVVDLDRQIAALDPAAADRPANDGLDGSGPKLEEQRAAAEDRLMELRLKAGAVRVSLRAIEDAARQWRHRAREPLARTDPSFSEPDSLVRFG